MRESLILVRIRDRIPIKQAEALRRSESGDVTGKPVIREHLLKSGKLITSFVNSAANSIFQCLNQTNERIRHTCTCIIARLLEIFSPFYLLALLC